MNVALPLSVKVSLWLLLNLLLLGTLGGLALAWQGGVGWDALVRGAPGERLQAVANLIAGELAVAPPDQVTGVLARLPASDAVQFALVDSRSGEVRGGAALSLPPELVAQLRGSQRGPVDTAPDELLPEDPPPPRFDPLRPPAPRPRGPVTPADLERGRHLLHVGEPAAWWFIVRLPPLEREGRPDPISIIGRAPSFYGVLRALDLKPWLFVGGAAVFVSILFWLPFVGSITRSLHRLGTATEKIAAGDFATRVPATRRDELGQLGESVNRMAAQLETLVNGQKKFLGDVAHELGSPLGRLQVAVEILESRADPAARPHIADVREEIQQLAALVNELLAFTRAGLRPRAADLVALELTPLLREVLVREAAVDRVQLHVPAALAVLADAPLLSRALGNLVRNALRYAGDSALIRFSTITENDRVCLALEDEGPGVPAEALARLGEPFYRPEEARTRETGGVGLGLSIVRSCVAACGGEVRFANRVPHGFRVELRLARAGVAPATGAVEGFTRP